MLPPLPEALLLSVHLPGPYLWSPAQAPFPCEAPLNPSQLVSSLQTHRILKDHGPSFCQPDTLEHFIHSYLLDFIPWLDSKVACDCVRTIYVDGLRAASSMVLGP